MESLLSMGFSQEQAKLALAASNGNLQVAIDILLSSPAPPKKKRRELASGSINKSAHDSVQKQVKRPRTVSEPSSTSARQESSSLPSTTRKSYVKIQETPEMKELMNDLYTSVLSKDLRSLKSSLQKLSRLPKEDANKIRNFATIEHQNNVSRLVELAVRQAPLIAHGKPIKNTEGVVSALLEAGFDPSYCVFF
eukprot:jgi/Bigna1/91119/estExt_fgenesh1_pg.C_890024